MNQETETLVATKWAIDQAHSEIQFKVKHMMLTNVTGQFTQFSGEIEMEETQLETAHVSFTAETSSISTGNDQRDVHLRGEEFFNSEVYPQLQFTNGKIVNSTTGLILTGDMTIRDITNRVELPVEFGGLGIDPWGNQKLGFSINGKINRKDFGLVWNSALEAGGVLVSDDVRIIAEIQLAKS
jgi:polyisoprenoid-binding protein YceI